MQTALDNVVALLDLEAIEVNIFRGRSPDDDRQRIFGGQVAGQALVAAARTVERGSVHSMHAYFLRAGDAKAPVLYDVDRIRDGRSFTTRRVVAIQHGRAIFQLAASFHVAEDGFEHLEPMPEVPDPETLLPRTQRMQSQHPDRARPDRVQALDIRYVTTSPLDRTGPLPPTQLVWMRANGTLGDDPVLHACLLTYASDLTLLDTTLAPHGTSAADPSIMLAQPRPRHVVPRAVPGRRVAALRPAHPRRRRRPGPGHRPGVHPRRTAGGVGGPGGPDPAAQIVTTPTSMG